MWALQPISVYISSSSSFQMFKGPDKDIEFIYTAPSSAVCGVSLDIGGKKEYLIAGVYVETIVECSWRWPGLCLLAPGQRPGQLRKRPARQRGRCHRGCSKSLSSLPQWLFYLLELEPDGKK